MQNQYFEPTPDAHARSPRFEAGGPASKVRSEPDDFRPQVQLTLHGPNDLAISSIIRFEADGAVPAAALRLLARPGAAGATAVHALPLEQLMASTTVALSVAGLAPGRYALWADSLGSLSATAVWLVDTYAGARVNLRQEPVYIFTAVAAAPGRFWLHMVPLAGPTGPAAGSATGLRTLKAPEWAQA